MGKCKRQGIDRAGIYSHALSKLVKHNVVYGLFGYRWVCCHYLLISAWNSALKILVTGAAGFIGFHLTKRLLDDGHVVVGLDVMNDYYDVALKQARLAEISAHNQFVFVQTDLANRQAMDTLFAEGQFDCVVNLAAQAGVRYSLENPHSYIDSNITGFLHVLEGCRHHNVGQLIYASSSSVYGLDEAMPFAEGQTADHPLSLYGATKKANEVMAHSYSNLYGLPTTGLRFFTVYGPWSRPDMAMYLFTKAIFAGEPIKIFNNGELMRDFTYVDDIVEGIVRLVDKPAAADEAFDQTRPDTGTSKAPYRVFNIGNGKPVPLMDYITAIEEAIGSEAIKEFLPMQPGDARATNADTTRLDEWVGFQPNTSVKEGVAKFVAWYRNYHNV